MILQVAISRSINGIKSPCLCFTEDLVWSCVLAQSICAREARGFAATDPSHARGVAHGHRRTVAQELNEQLKDVNERIEGRSPVGLLRHPSNEIDPSLFFYDPRKTIQPRRGKSTEGRPRGVRGGGAAGEEGDPYHGGGAGAE